MLNYLALAAQRSGEEIELFLYVENSTAGSLTVQWTVEIPAYVQVMVNSSDLKGELHVLPNETHIQAGSWTLHQPPLHGQIEGEVVADATIQRSDGTFVSDSARGRLSGILTETLSKPKS